MTSLTSLTPEQTIVLQSFLIRQSEQWRQYQREYPGLLDLASYHVAPDGAWVAVEHERQSSQECPDGTAESFIFRLSPACTHLVTKI